MKRVCTQSPGGRIHKGPAIDPEFAEAWVQELREDCPGSHWTEECEAPERSNQDELITLVGDEMASAAEANRRSRSKEGLQNYAHHHAADIFVPDHDQPVDLAAELEVIYAHST